MSALSIPAPFPIFSDTTGAPLDSGYIYIGAANQDPVTNPIAAYWDAALTIPAVQPIRTSGGYPVYNGSPTNIYVNTDYSIRVNNSNGVFVYAAPTATERLSGIVVTGVDAANVSYLPAGTGAVTTTLQSKLRESVSVKDFGAVGDGVTDDAAAFTRAFAASKSVNLGGSGSVYLIASYIAIPDQTLYDSTARYLIGNGATVKIQAAAAPFTSASWANNQTLTTNPYTGKLFVSGVNFIGTAADGVFDCDHIYNLQVRNCHFDGMNRVFISRHMKTGAPNGYIQSLYVSDCIFSEIQEYIVKAKKAYNVVFSENMFENCQDGIFINGTPAENSDVYAVNNIRLVNNLFEGGGVFAACASVLAGVATGNYFEANTQGSIGVRKCHLDLNYDTVAVGGSNPSTWVIDGNSSQDTLDQRNDVSFGMFSINGSYDSVCARGNWADSSVTVSPVVLVDGNYSRRFQKYIGTKSAQRVGIDSFSSVLQRPISYSLVSGTILQFASLTLPDNIAVPYRGGALNMSVILKSMTAAGAIFAECCFDCKVFISPYGSGVVAAGQPTYWDIKGTISNYLEQQATVVDSAAGASTVNVFTATPVFSFSRSGSVIHLRASNFNAATIPTYGAITTVLACITISGNGLSDRLGSAFNWITMSN